jgi:alpha-ribazole phosphatase/probable phosphoglycerate mutase
MERRFPVIQDKRLRECSYGDFNGRSSEIVEPMQEKCIWQRFPNGESYEDVKARIADFLEFLKANYDGKTIGIVAHKAPQLALDVLLGAKAGSRPLTRIGASTRPGSRVGIPIGLVLHPYCQIGIKCYPYEV